MNMHLLAQREGALLRLHAHGAADGGAALPVAAMVSQLDGGRWFWSRMISTSSPDCSWRDERHDGAVDLGADVVSPMSV